MTSLCFRRILIGGSAGLGLLGTAALAAPPAAVPYPIVDLGSCRDRRECALYCEIPAHFLECWYWENVTRPRVLQATTPEQTVSIAGQTLTYDEAAGFCADPANADACVAAARAAGVQPELPPEYRSMVQEVGAAGKDPLSLMESAMSRYKAAPTADRQRYESLALERLPEDLLNPAHAALKHLREAGLNVTTVSEAATACAQGANAVLCHAAAVSAGFTNTGFRGAFGHLVSGYARSQGAQIRPGVTLEMLQRGWERLPAPVRNQIVAEAEERFVEAAPSTAEDLPPEAARCKALQYPERAACFKSLFHADIGGGDISPEAQRCKALQYPERAACFKNLYLGEPEPYPRPVRGKPDFFGGPGLPPSPASLPTPAPGETFEQWRNRVLPTAPPESVIPIGRSPEEEQFLTQQEKDLTRRLQEEFNRLRAQAEGRPYERPPAHDDRLRDQPGAETYPGGRPTNGQLYDQARRGGMPVPPPDRVFRETTPPFSPPTTAPLPNQYPSGEYRYPLPGGTYESGGYQPSRGDDSGGSGGYESGGSYPGDGRGGYSF